MESQPKSALFRTGNRLKVAVATAMSILFLTAFVASPASAISMPNIASCVWNTTFGADDYFHFKIPNYGTGQVTPLCYQDAGTLWNMGVSDVAGIHSGNNAGLLEYEVGGSYYLYGFAKWYDDFNYYGTVAMLTIY